MRKLRILHVVGGMNRGGVETWLMQVLRHSDRDRYEMDFLVHTTNPCPYDAEVLALGSRIIPCPNPSHPIQYARQFARLLRVSGAYDILHSHVHHYSGFTLRLAEQAGIPVRIAHSHNDTTTVEAIAGLHRQFYLHLTEAWIRRHATLGLACSQQAAASLYGSQWQTDPRWQVLPYGIDLAPFQTAINREAVRAAFNLPADAFVVGHVGRFNQQKNHPFLVEIAAAILQRDPTVYFLWVGDGVLRPEIQQQVQQRGCSDRIVFAGLQPNVPELMRSAMDCFLFPSHYEGLGLVLVEAQAAGLPCIISDRVPAEASVISELVERVSLNQSADEWAALVLGRKNATQASIKMNAVQMVEQSPFNIKNSVQSLVSCYQSASTQAVKV